MTAPPTSRPSGTKQPNRAATPNFTSIDFPALSSADLKTESSKAEVTATGGLQVWVRYAQACASPRTRGREFHGGAAAVNVTVDTATLDQACAVLTALRTSVTDTSFTYGASYTAAEKARCVANFQQRIDLVLAQLDAANATANALRAELPRVQANAAALAPVAGAVNATARAITADVVNVTSVIAGYIASEHTRLITTKVPAVKSAVAQFATDTDAYLATSLSCCRHGHRSYGHVRIATQIKEEMAAGVHVMRSALLPVEVKKVARSRAGSVVPQEGGGKKASGRGSVVPERSAMLAPSSPM
ncbi:hypothetical protein AMAG_13509 [Allomyces macrogynus ATCC 38327]|uniref:Uncharacterized protein n=1 Tax=Allomyces macrogynus (strain ATCC 38327) TaxID=578462 RepID=A0A0L0T2I8_ALLM3|nr:hypothetical protein AMAG_13509 [Allomyces macrogynus ATCC 38327]|eukprot:KNE68870.1 hypothetical protein AMAG_13509 [Allomyces macrogynus ATCC 38327]